MMKIVHKYELNMSENKSQICHKYLLQQEKDHYNENNLINEKYLNNNNNNNKKHVINEANYLKMNLNSRQNYFTNKKEMKRSSEFLLILIFCTIFFNTIGYTHGFIHNNNNNNNKKQNTDHAHSSYLNHLNKHSHHNFKSHTLIRPKLFHGIHKTALSHTREETGLHATHLTLHYQDNGQNVIIDLKLNDNLIPKGHFVRYHLPNGDKVIKNFTKTDVDLCHYHGKIRNNHNSHVAVSTCNGIRGVVWDEAETYYIESGPNGTIHSDHTLYRHSDMSHEHKCGYEGGINATHDLDLFMESEYGRIARFKRALPTNQEIRGPYNANRHSSYVELLMVIDNKIYQGMDRSIKRVHQYCKDIVNIVNGLYVPLNIFIALVGVVIWTENNEVELSSNGDTTLKNFLHYRKRHLVKEHPNDNAQLLTKETFESGVVGKALKGPICTYEFSGGVSIDHSPIIGVVATTVAHEMGHNFGMEHDTADCVCKDDKCIMSASSSSIAPRHWSQCSVDQLNLAFHHGMNHCLKNKPEKLFESPVCGNNFVEPGEECDCGLAEYCDNSCCDPATCKLRQNATCATGQCCDLNTCMPKTAGSVCRSADTECDLPEFCNGDSEYCPFDVFKRDSESCGNGKAYCFQGACKTHSDQCKLLWGPSGQSTDQCYTKNAEGTRHGNCGYDRHENQYLKCRQEDTLCGMVHCRHLNERLEFGMESVAVLSHSFMNYKGSIIPCRTAIVDLGLETRDPGLTPDGAKCGEDKMCLNQTCVSIEGLKTGGRFPSCPDDCNGNGVCNSLGNCHCDVGFLPPFCDKPGPGGSVDSGPATDPDEGSGIRNLILVFFLGVIPTAVIAAFLIYYWKQNHLVPTRKAPSIPPKQLLKSSGPNSPPSFGSSTPNSPDDMNSALLKKSSSTDTDSSINNNMFGKFKGFSLKPLAQTNGPIGASNIAYVHPVTKIVPENNKMINGPTKVAPPVPKPPTVVNNHAKNPPKQVVKPNNVVPPVHYNSNANDFSTAAPALPPLNPGQTGRPIISSPILENSTCTRKELDSPLRMATGSDPKQPTRPAPPKPATSVVKTAAPISPELLVNPELPANNKDKKLKDGPLLNRITSFLKKDEKIMTEPPKPTNNPKPVLKTNRKPIDRERLKTIEISCPIPIVEDVHSPTTKENEISRTQSMRDSNTLGRRPNNYGASMRQAGKRPTSIVGRPTLPPPPRPSSPTKKFNTIDTSKVVNYENPPPPKKVTINENVCRSPVRSPIHKHVDMEVPLAHISEESSPMTPVDNIYDEIAESPSPPHLHSTSTESMGLLGEIVSEIENRNFDAMYIASTLNRKKKAPKNDSVYANTAEISPAESEEEEYTAPKSVASTTSSGYLRPTGFATPVARVAPTNKPTRTVTSSNSMSSFKSPPSGSGSNSSSSDFKSPDLNSITFTSPLTSSSSQSSNQSTNLSKIMTTPSKPESLRTYKPYHTTINRPGPYLASVQAKNNDKQLNDKIVAPLPKTSTFRTRSPSPKGNNKSIIPNGTVKSPDIIPKTKQPDVLNRVEASQPNKPKPVSTKPSVSQKFGAKPTKTGNQTAGSKSISKPVPGKVSHVASLQKKFEHGAKN